jgi:hypothetical protein
MSQQQMGKLLLTIWLLVCTSIPGLRCNADDEVNSGSTDAYCGQGCQPGFGSCKVAAVSSRASSGFATSTIPAATPSRSATPPTQPVSKNARCGAGFGGQTCEGSRWGNCCSKYFYVSSIDRWSSAPS